MLAGGDEHADLWFAGVLRVEVPQHVNHPHVWLGGVPSASGKPDAVTDARQAEVRHGREFPDDRVGPVGVADGDLHGSMVTGGGPDGNGGV